MLKQSRISSAVILMGMTVALCSAQSIISAHSGTLHYFDGDVTIDGAPVQAKVARFAEIKEQSVLRTGRGRAEVLLTPGVFLRVGENSAIKMLDNRLISTRVEILSGNAMVESDDPQMSIKDSPVSLIYKDYEIRLVKHGLVEISTDPAQLKVYKGEAVVDITTGDAANGRAAVKEGRQLPFSAALLTENFDDKVGDDLYLWTRDRSQSISAANMSSARTLNGSGLGSGFGGGYDYGDLYGYGVGNGYGLGYPGGWNGGWYFNPYFDMFTFVPGGGTYWNAFGYGFFSPGTVYNYYQPSVYWYGGGGARGTGSVGRPLAGIATRSSGGHPPSLSSLQPRSSTPVSGLGMPRGISAPSTSFGGFGGGFAGSAGGGGGSFSSRGGGGGGGGAAVSAGGHGGGGRR